ncbi:SdpI family protein [Corynebacterium sp. TAE3-ERU12]|uniref:SdpI family protein n=1 Tax=Corynebacterium sp. TAE3-ERU12 TaxID=2849491 RepID=UPI001C45655C|nr:SdpI family protein [Corynebacterium sp. TAE3-ERU12]
MEPSGYISLAIGNFLLTILSYAIAKASLSGNLTRNSALGIRTKHTTLSDAAWDAAHKKAAPYLMASAMVGAVAIVIDITFLLIFKSSTSDYHDLLIITPIMGFVIQVAVLICAALSGNREAKRYAN